MAFIVEIFRDRRNENNYLIIDIRLSSWQWNKFIEIGINNGWKQLGTEKPMDSKLESFNSNYNPDYPHRKKITKEDAANWSFALKKYIVENNESEIQINGPHLITENETNTISIKSEMNNGQLVEFIEYLDKGEFYFWYDE